MADGAVLPTPLGATCRKAREAAAPSEKWANPQDDVWTILSTVQVETEDGEHTALSEIELDMFFLLLITAGSETTRNAVSLGLLALLDHPGEPGHSGAT